MKILLTENQCREIAAFVIANYNQRPMNFELEISGSQIKIPVHRQVLIDKELADEKRMDDKNNIQPTT